MEADVLKNLGQVAGLGGLAVGTFLLLMRDIIRKDIFSRIAGIHTFRLFRLAMILIWSIAIFGMLIWAFADRFTISQSAATNQTVDTGTILGPGATINESHINLNDHSE